MNREEKMRDNGMNREQKIREEVRQWELEQKESFYNQYDQRPTGATAAMKPAI